MSAPHFFADPDALGQAAPGSIVDLSEEDSNHALRALRLRMGERVTLADGAGAWCEGVLVDRREGRARVEITEGRRVPRPQPLVVVGLAPPKGDRLSWAIQKLTEIGVDEVQVMEPERTVRRPESGATDSRLNAVARQAAMQSRRPFLTRLSRGRLEDPPPVGEVTVMLHQAAPLRLAQALPEATAALRLLVGPEGGYTDGEVEAAIASGAAVASLGPAILRTETAAVVGATLALARYGRLG